MSDQHEPATNGHQSITTVHTPSTDLVPVDVTDDVVDEFGGVDIRLGTYLHEVLQWGASDLHVTAGRPPMVRIDGTIRPRDTETDPRRPTSSARCCARRCPTRTGTSSSPAARSTTR